MTQRVGGGRNDLRERGSDLVVMKDNEELEVADRLKEVDGLHVATYGWGWMGEGWVSIPSQRTHVMLRLTSRQVQLFLVKLMVPHIERIFPLESHFVLTLCQPNMHKRRMERLRSNLLLNQTHPKW
jgi:hypothetical protein